MSFLETIRTAVANTFRSRLRATLTILAIFVGAFTLTLTNGLGTGITRFINAQVSAFGAEDIMSVRKAEEFPGGFPGQGQSGPAEYDPEQASFGAVSGFDIPAMTAADVESLAAIDGVLAVEPLKLISADYIRVGEGTRYEITVSSMPPGADLDLLAGTSALAAERNELILPVTYLDVLGFSSSSSALGEVVLIGVSSVFGTVTEVPATVVGVQEETLFALGALISPALTDELYEGMTSGLPAAVADLTLGATIWFDPSLGTVHANRIKADIAALGLVGETVADQLGTLQTVINAVIGVLNAFAVIALIAAGFGIINTLYMSVQERTREIGLMKAMGMGAGSIFALFSAEAAFIGFLGSAIGSVAAIVLGTVVSEYLVQGPLAALPGLRVLAFDPVSVLTVVLLVMLLAFLAGTLPASRAARLDPIDALRYE